MFEFAETCEHEGAQNTGLAIVSKTASTQHVKIQLS